MVITNFMFFIEVELRDSNYLETQVVVRALKFAKVALYYLKWVQQKISDRFFLFATVHA
jgi:hypothetical protein